MLAHVPQMFARLRKRTEIRYEMLLQLVDSQQIHAAFRILILFNLRNQHSKQLHKIVIREIEILCKSLFYFILGIAQFTLNTVYVLYDYSIYYMIYIQYIFTYTTTSALLTDYKFSVSRF